MNFSENLKIIRNEKQLTQEKLAELLSVSRQAVSKWESGQGYPEIDKLVKLSDLFEISLDELIREPSNQSITQSDSSRAKNSTKRIIIEKQTATLFGIEFDPDIALKMFWAGTMLGAFAAATYYLTS